MLILLFLDHVADLLELSKVFTCDLVSISLLFLPYDKDMREDLGVTEVVWAH